MVGGNFNVAHHHVAIEREAQIHVVHMHPGVAPSAVRLGNRIGLLVDDARLDVPEAVVAFEAFAADRARVQVAARCGGGKAHGCLLGN